MAKRMVAIHQLQHSLYRYMRKKASSYEGEMSSDLLSYRNNQRKWARRDFELSHLKELLKSIESSQIVYLGDFHTFDQSSRNLQRLIKTLLKTRKKIILGVEFIHHQYQQQIDHYVKKHITELEFLEAIQYKESWRFPWVHYRIFFDLARKQKVQILALNSKGSLKQRDEFAAKLICEHTEHNPRALMLVLFGEYHITPNKLPALVKKRCTSCVEQTLIHQNLDQVYWGLEKLEKHTESQIVKFSENEFSLQTSPPWIKYESMIYWYENLIEDPDFEIHHYMLETGFMALNSSVPDTFHYISHQVAAAIHYIPDKSVLEDFNIYDHQKMDFVLEQIDKLPTTSLRSQYTQFVKEGRKFKLPFSRIYYCSSYSVNRISFLAGLHLLDIYQSGESPDYEHLLIGKNNNQKFVFICYQMMMGYFSSKIINPYRKCDLYGDILKKLHHPKLPLKKRNELKLVKRVLDLVQKDNDDSLDLILKGLRSTGLSMVAKHVGYILGDRLFEHHYSKSSKTFNLILADLKNGHFEDKEFFLVLKKLLPAKAYKEQNKRLF